jgi:hypothetical protein
VLRNLGIGLIATGALLQWRGHGDGPLLLLVGFLVAVSCGFRNKLDQDLKVGALNGYEDALANLRRYQGEGAETLRSNGWADLMIEQHRRECHEAAASHYERLLELRFVPLRPSLPGLVGRQLEDLQYRVQTLIRQETPAHDK